MVKKMIVPVIVISVIFASPAIYSGDREKAAGILRRAVEYYNANGEAAFIEAINKKKMFHEGDIYVWSLKTDFRKSAVIVAHLSDILVDREGYDVKDAKGKFFIREILKKAQRSEKGAVEYYWVHPLTKKVSPKVSYFQRVDDMIILCGYYK